MQNILEEIVANKRIEVEQAKLLVSLDELKKAADSAPPVRSLRKSIESHHEGASLPSSSGVHHQKTGLTATPK